MRRIHTGKSRRESNMSTEFEALNQEHLNDSPQQIIELALQRFDNLAISFSGAEDVVLIHMAAKLCKKLGRALNVFSLDTGRLHPETYRYIDKVSQHFKIQIDIISPNAEKLEAFTKEKIVRALLNIPEFENLTSPTILRVIKRPEVD